jgi:uncharacterized protein (TIGR02246 family)
LRELPTRTPEEVLLLLARALTAGDLQSAVALYEPEATFVAQPGTVVTGTEAIREALSGFVALKPTFDLKVRKVFRSGGDDIALAFSEWTLAGTGPDGETMSMSGQGSDVVRQQPDGSWLFVIDNPYGHAGAVSPGDV